MSGLTILTLKEAAAYLKVSPSYIRLLVHEGLIPYRQCKDKCCITFSRDALDEWWLEYHKPLPAKIRIKKLKLIRGKKHG